MWRLLRMLSTIFHDLQSANALIKLFIITLGDFKPAVAFIFLFYQFPYRIDEAGLLASRKALVFWRFKFTIARVAVVFNNYFARLDLPNLIPHLPESPGKICILWGPPCQSCCMCTYRRKQQQIDWSSRSHWAATIIGRWARLPRLEWYYLASLPFCYYFQWDCCTFCGIGSREPVGAATFARAKVPSHDSGCCRRIAPSCTVAASISFLGP